ITSQQRKVLPPFPALGLDWFLLIFRMRTLADLSLAPVSRREPRFKASRIAFWGVVVRRRCRTRQLPLMATLPLRWARLPTWFTPSLIRRSSEEKTAVSLTLPQALTI